MEVRPWNLMRIYAVMLAVGVAAALGGWWKLLLLPAGVVAGWVARKADEWDAR